MPVRFFVCISVAIVAAAQPASTGFPYEASGNTVLGPPSHDFPGLATPHSDRWDNINPPEPSVYIVTPGPQGPVSADQLRHPLTGKALSMIKKAEKLIAARDYIHAREELKKATKDSGAAPYAHSLLGQEYVRAMQFPEAIQELDQAVQSFPSNVPDHANLGYALIMTGHPAPAEQELRRALELQPSNPRTHLVMGVLCYTVGNRDQEAQEHLEFAARELPSAHLMLARFFRLTGHPEAAAKEFEVYRSSPGAADTARARPFMEGAVDSKK